MRAFLLVKLYEISKKPYQKYIKKNKPWEISAEDLLKYPNHTLGFHLSCFLLKNSFELQPKLESHDVYHVLTNTGVSVTEEINMQYYFLGNGKHSLYMFTVIGIGTLLYPNHFKNFKHAYHRGNKSLKFHQIDFSKLLHLPIQRIRNTFLIQ
mgnify:CR=1 FL=1|tara:strand:- start:24579 stop:25034 length:456 start_codon:yes stop_codon:yes gene_type:complete